RWYGPAPLPKFHDRRFYLHLQLTGSGPAAKIPSPPVRIAKGGFAMTCRTAWALGLTGIVLLGGAVAWGLFAGNHAERAAGNWPQGRGPERNSVTKETGLLKTWPEKGPALAWKATGLGDGVASVAVVGGRVYTLGKSGEDEQVIALEETTGKRLWS